MRNVGLTIVALVTLFWGMAASQTISTVAGGAPYPGAAYAPTTTSIGFPTAVVADGAGNVYVASIPVDGATSAILKISTTGAMTVYAGTGDTGYSGDGGPATAAQLDLGESLARAPFGLAVDSAGDLYIPDLENCAIREVSAASGTITTVAGTGKCGYSGDGAAAKSAQLNLPTAVALDASGNLYIADWGNCRVRQVAVATGSIQTVAGTGTCGSFSTEQTVTGLATAVPIGGPKGIALDGNGNLYIVDGSNAVIWQVAAATGHIAIIAGQSPLAPGICSQATNTNGYGDGCPATQARLVTPTGIGVDAAGDLFIGESIAMDNVREVNAKTGIISAAGGVEFPIGQNAGVTGDDGPASEATFGTPAGVYAYPNGDLLIADANDFGFPNFTRIRKVVAQTGIISTMAGNGFRAYSGDGSAAVNAQIAPSGMALDASGDIVTAERDNDALRKVSAATGAIQSLSGDFASSDCGDGVGNPTTHAGDPVGVAIDASGDIFYSSPQSDSVCEISAATGNIATIAGAAGQVGYSGDGGLATSATLNGPQQLALDNAGNLYIADAGNNVIREVVAATGVIETVAGTGTAGFAGDGGAATAAELHNPLGVTVDGAGNVYIADTNNQVIREVAKATGSITTVAGTGAEGGYAGDGSVATAAKLGLPSDVAVDSAGNIFITDSANGAIREVFASTGIIETLTGFGSTVSRTFAGAAAGLVLYPPLNGIAVDPGGNVYFADGYANVIRKIVTQPQPTLSASSLAFGNEGVATASSDQTVTISNSAGSGLLVSSVTVAGANAQDFSATDNCSSTVAVGSTCAVQVTFTPGAEGARSATLTITDNSLSSPHTIPLTGTGTEAIANVSASTLTFAGEVLTNTSASQTVTVSNSGNAALSISSVGISGDFAQTNNCGSSLAPNASCDVKVTFTPTMTGSRTGTLTVSDNAASNTQAVALSGTGEDIVIAPVPGSPSAVTVSPGQTAQYSLGLTPAGGFTGNVAVTCGVQPSTLVSCTATPASFTLSGTAGQTVAVTIATTAASAAAPLPDMPSSAPPASAYAFVLALLGLIAAAAPRQKRGARRTLLLGAATVLLLLTGCGGANNLSRLTSPGTPAGAYTVTVSATAAGGSRTAQLTFTVN